MESALYTGTVAHRRSAVVCNTFRYGLFFLYLDLAELDHLFDQRWLWSVERSNWASFRRGDHLRQPGPLDPAVRSVVKQQLGFCPTGPIRLLTHLRYLGYCFNPISIYYCFADDGTTLEAIVPEVHNTPWGEEYVRALDVRTATADAGWYAFQLEKEFHVSPFMPMEINYTWCFTDPEEGLGVRMENSREGVPVFTADLSLRRRPLTGKNLAQALLTWPFMTGQVIGAIYWQAIKIKLKGVPYYPHPDKMSVTKGMFHR